MTKQVEEESMKGVLCILFLSLLQLKSWFSFDCTFLPVFMVSCLVTSPFVCLLFCFLTLLAHSYAYVSEMSSVFETDRLFSFTCGPFLLFIKELAGGNWSMLLCVTWCWKILTECLIMPASPSFMCHCAQGQHQKDYRLGMHV